MKRLAAFLLGLLIVGAVSANVTNFVTPTIAASQKSWGVPVLTGDSGTMANNGAVTLGTALPFIIPQIYICVPANAVATGTPAAATCLYATCSSTTACVLFNNALSGIPIIPASPTAFVTTAPGAYTGLTSAQTALSFILTGGSLGSNGSLYLRTNAIESNNADTRTQSASLGGTQIGQFNAASNSWLGTERLLINQGVQNVQYLFSTSANNASDRIAGTNAPAKTTIDTSVNQTFAITISVGTATDYYVLLGGSVTASYAP